MKPFSLSVVIPLYNKRDHIERALRSVLDQTLPPDEIIVVDDGSTDGSADLAEQFAGVEVIRQKNEGVSGARNRGAWTARSRFVAFLDADDYWSAHFLAEVERLHREFPKAKLLATAYQFAQDNTFRDPKLYTATDAGPGALRHAMTDFVARAGRGDLPFSASSVCVEREELIRLGGFPHGEVMGEDQDVWLSFALDSQIAYSRRSLSYYCEDASNRACQKLPPSRECLFSKRATLLSELTPSRSLRRDLLAYSASHLIDLASRHVRHGRLKTAFKLLLDGRTQFLPLRRGYWLARCGIAMATRWLQPGRAI